MRIIAYYQTFNGLEDILVKNSPITHIHLSSIHFGKDPNTEDPYIHLNNLSPYHSNFNKVWNQLKQATKLGIKVKLMIGGAGGGYSTLFSNFDLYYGFLKKLLIDKQCISGIDLDIEEEVDLENVKKLMRQIKLDFGTRLSISMAPVQSSLQTDDPGLGGFIYKELLQSPEGSLIDYFNGQFYSDYSLNAYESVIKNGYRSDMVVMGNLASSFPSCDSEIKKIIDKYGNKFGGVFIWEYCFAPPNPGQWSRLMHSLLHPTENNNNDEKKNSAFCLLS